MKNDMFNKVASLQANKDRTHVSPAARKSRILLLKKASRHASKKCR